MTLFFVLSVCLSALSLSLYPLSALCSLSAVAHYCSVLLQAVKADTLPDGTQIEAGTIVSFDPFAFGRSAQLWGADVLQFKPERWYSAAATTQPLSAGVEEDNKKEQSELSGFDRATTHLKRFSQYQFPSFSGGLRYVPRSIFRLFFFVLLVFCLFGV